MSYCSLAQIGSPMHCEFAPAIPLADIEYGEGGGSLSTIIPASNRHSINVSIPSSKPSPRINEKNSSISSSDRGTPNSSTAFSI
ncbi:MAG TPA: hypothetical protein VE445_05170 [Nitrososphaeraceae archaeon]|nr:hypothetical protein [Nitrososphaeraceae archaeon]